MDVRPSVEVTHRMAYSNPHCTMSTLEQDSGTKPNDKSNKKREEAKQEVQGPTIAVLGTTSIGLF